ncbi:MAG: 2,3-bisphosphoglycerate-independent phosphoglycerate mutase [Actinomycetota bacterium]|nr:2,3-bisphosphoglycerate-independent phosphoglycerate mutase [Actinomycetota bacterium]
MSDPVCLIILDGFGVAPVGRTNAVTVADKPNYDAYTAMYPHTTLNAAGTDVGLPAGQMGNSEVGHLNIGAGRIVYQDLTRIDKAIEDGSFGANPVLIEAVDKAKAGGAALHLLGLLSDGGVHSHNTHLYALLKLAKDRGLEKVFVHCFLDGRDTPPRSALKYVKDLEDELAVIGAGKIATVSGRYFAMDRDNRWERTLAAYQALVNGEGARAESATAAVEQSYEDGANDEFMQPTVIDGVDGRIEAGDSVIFFNFRADRARQLTAALTQPGFDGFERGPAPPKVFFVCLALYDIDYKLPAAFGPEPLDNILAEVISARGLKQLHIAETEKYAHVTFFFNGGIEQPYPGEDRILVPSPKVATYDLKPEMSAPEVADKVVAAVDSGSYDFIVVNFANCDMVGHTGILTAAVRAIEAVDRAIGRVVEAVRRRGGAVIITADHGNSEQMAETDGKPRTAHTVNRVPMIYISDDRDAALKSGGRLADIAPTILTVMGIPVPPEMTGTSLLDSRPKTPQAGQN